MLLSILLGLQLDANVAKLTLLPFPKATRLGLAPSLRPTSSFFLENSENSVSLAATTILAQSSRQQRQRLQRIAGSIYSTSNV